MSQSPLYKGNNGFLPVDKNCLEKLFQHYIVLIGDEYEAFRRVCMKYDIYYNSSIADGAKKVASNRSKINAYISKSYLAPHGGKTYDDTIQEETTETIDSLEDVKENKDIKISQKTIRFFGLGFTEEEYKWLSDQYDDWTTRNECKTKAQEELFKNICLSQLQIQKAIQNGNGKVETLMKTFQELLGSSNLKPAQTNENTLADQNTFGTLIQKWENEKPISDPDPVWKDVDGIRKYVNVWFLGHLCKMMGIKNSYSQEYEDEILKYKVERPTYEDEEESDNSDLDSMFNDGM